MDYGQLWIQINFKKILTTKKIMKKYILYLIVSLNTTNSFSQDSTLFVGNSMVKYDKNHTLEILQRIIK